MNSGSRKIAIHAHVFYDELWAELAVCINNFTDVCGADNVDVFITYPDGKPQMREALPKLLNAPPCKIIPVPNRGYDVGPFFAVLNDLDLDAYDYVVKLHTKRDVPFCVVNFHIMRGGEWRRELLSFCNTPNAVSASLKALARDETLGMIAGRSLIDYSGVGSAAEGVGDSWNVLSGCGVESTNTTVVYGTMFMVRAKLLKPIYRKVYNDQFPLITTENAHRDFRVAGAWEGAFSILVVAQGYRVAFGRWPRMASCMFYAAKRILFIVLRAVMNRSRGIRQSK